STAVTSASDTQRAVEGNTERPSLSSSAVATWAQLRAAEPALAEAGRQLLYQYGPGLGFLATVRRDGGPRVHPVCPVIDGDGLYVFVGNHSPKVHDLRRDGRFALHTFPMADNDDEFYVAGTTR